MKLNKTKIFKTTLTIIVLILIISVLVYLFPIIRDISTKEGQIKFKETMGNSGIVGFFALFGLQFAQIFLVIIPGEPIEILAGMCYGSFLGTIFIMISAMVISTFVFFLVRKYGKKFVYNFCNKEKVDKIENSKLFEDPKKIDFIIFLLFLIPGTPKDLLVYIAGLLPIKPARFIIISTIARFPSVISSTLAGSNIIMGNWKLSIILYVGIIAIVGIILLLINKFDKNKSTEKILKTIK